MTLIDAPSFDRTVRTICRNVPGDAWSRHAPVGSFTEQDEVAAKRRGLLTL
ncbi:hypothetical protein [Microbacterium sp.]|uniref:hypothetical protein n=1 Tax=Microbacterium sp. TaxID=51671 RepID=UPI003A94CFD3